MSDCVALRTLESIKQGNGNTSILELAFERGVTGRFHDRLIGGFKMLGKKKGMIVFST
jgi:hypothetical protein